MKSLYVSNAIRVGNYLKVNLNNYEDLFLSKNHKVQDFIQKYIKYFESNNADDIKEFYDLTGLFLTHVYQVSHEDDLIKRITITPNGIFGQLQNETTPNISNEHLFLVENGNHFNIIDGKVMLDDKPICKIEELKKNSYHKNEAAKYNFEKLKYDKQSVPSLKLLKEQNYLVPNQKITYITMDLFRNVISLTDNGDLYLNETLYAKEVKHIIEFNSKDIYFIYQNNWVEHYSSSHVEHNRMQHYDKVLYGYNYLVTLKEKMVKMYFFVNIAYNCYLTEDETFDMIFDEVDDITIEIEDEIDVLVLYKNKEKIKMPIVGICKLS